VEVDGPGRVDQELPGVFRKRLPTPIDHRLQLLNAFARECVGCCSRSGDTDSVCDRNMCAAVCHGTKIVL
jgi:hypothetical protein